MTEAEWLTATHPRLLLRRMRRRASDRKLRLFAVACYRQCEPLMGDAHARSLVDIVEQFADGGLTAGEWASAALESREQRQGGGGPESLQRSTLIALFGSARGAAEHGTFTAAILGAGRGRRRGQIVRAAMGVQSCLCRDIFGNPFRPVTFTASWRTDTALSLARQMYDAREFSAMPILADALQDAGCDNEDILNHCRGPGPHVRGCWVIDLLTGRK